VTAAADYGYIFDVAQLAHVELLTTDLERSLWFFRDLIGMEEVARKDGSVYLRAYDERYLTSLKLTPSEVPGLGHAAWRARSPQALERRVKAIEATGLGQGWIDGDIGHGPAYRFTTPEGHQMEIFWEVEWYQASGALESRLPNRPQKRPARGVPVRRLDHINLFAKDVKRCGDFMMEALGFQLREYIEARTGGYKGVWLSVSPLVHEIAFMYDEAGPGGRLHHICYWYGYPHQLWEVGDLFRENRIHIELGPAKHGITQAMPLYVYEPGGNRVELFGDIGYLIFEPDWKPIRWTEDHIERAAQEGGLPWLGGSFPLEYWVYGTPTVEQAARAARPATQAPAD